MSRAMRTHGGGIRLLELGRDGAVRVGFTGLCASCQLRPLTFAHTIEPALASVPGVSRVSADGARISDEALVRIRRYFTDPSYSIE
ncbi:MAG: NifU family protein [Trebonia sp.]